MSQRPFCVYVNHRFRTCLVQKTCLPLLVEIWSAAMFFLFCTLLCFWSPTFKKYSPKLVSFLLDIFELDYFVVSMLSVILCGPVCQPLWCRAGSQENDQADTESQRTTITFPRLLRNIGPIYTYMYTTDTYNKKSWTSNQSTQGVHVSIFVYVCMFSPCFCVGVPMSSFCFVWVCPL